MPPGSAAALGFSQSTRDARLQPQAAWPRSLRRTASLLIKLHDDGMACTLADRAVQAAAAGNDPLIMAESQRLAATVLRRIDHRDSAQKLVLDAAGQLRGVSPTRDAAYSAMYGQLLAVAAYTAAIRDHRDTAWTLLGEAEHPARDAGQAARFNSTEIAVYHISVARKLGDYGAAVDFARKVDPEPSPVPGAGPATGKTPRSRCRVAAGPAPRSTRY
jgi:hypothetical protein